MLDVDLAIGIFTNTQTLHYCTFFIPIYSRFLLYFHIIMLIKVKLDVTGYKRTLFQMCRLY